MDISSLTVAELKELLVSIRKQLHDAGLHTNISNAGRPPRHDYASWDWTKKNWELAREHGVGYVTVMQHRKRLGKAKVPGGKHYPACLSWDWSKSDTAISRENKIDVGSVRNWRNRLGKPNVARDVEMIGYPPLHASNVFDWESVDWSEHDRLIAERLGCTRERVRQKRARLGKPRTQFYMRKYLEFEKVFGGCKELTLEQARERFPSLSHRTFRRYLAKLGITLAMKPRTYPPKLYPWHLMNFELPNALLVSIWKVKNHQSVAQHRSDVEKPFPVWRCVNGNVPPERTAEVELEKQKAAQYFAEKQSSNGTHENQAPQTQP